LKDFSTVLVAVPRGIRINLWFDFSAHI